MVLVDTSVWIDHLRSGEEGLVSLLNTCQVLVHPFVMGELACGNLQNRKEVLTLLKDLPRILVAHDEEVVFFIEQHSLMGKGIGYVDAHLLASIALNGNAQLWSRDRRLRDVAAMMKLAYTSE